MSKDTSYNQKKKEFVRGIDWEKWKEIERKEEPHLPRHRPITIEEYRQKKSVARPVEITVKKRYPPRGGKRVRMKFTAI